MFISHLGWCFGQFIMSGSCTPSTLLTAHSRFGQTNQSAEVFCFREHAIVAFIRNRKVLFSCVAFNRPHYYSHCTTLVIWLAPGQAWWTTDIWVSFQAQIEVFLCFAMITFLSRNRSRCPVPMQHNFPYSQSNKYSLTTSCLSFCQNGVNKV